LNVFHILTFFISLNIFHIQTFFFFPQLIIKHNEIKKKKKKKKNKKKKKVSNSNNIYCNPLQKLKKLYIPKNSFKKNI